MKVMIPFVKEVGKQVSKLQKVLCTQPVCAWREGLRLGRRRWDVSAIYFIDINFDVAELNLLKFYSWAVKGIFKKVFASGFLLHSAAIK